MTEIAGAHAAAEVLTDGRRPMPDAAAAHFATDEARGVCPNCETPLVGAWCYACGQKAHLHNRLRDLAHEALEGLYHLDGRLWRTLPVLALDPGRLSRDWRAGKRVRYVSPLSAFLFAIFLLFLIPSLTGTHLIAVPTSVADAQARENSIIRIQTPGGQSQRVDPNAGPGRMVAWLNSRFARGDYYTAKIESLAYKLSFLIVPASMLILALLLASRRGYTFYDHGVVSLYGAGFFTYLMVINVLVGLAFSAAGVHAVSLRALVILIGGVHAYVHLKGAYQLGWWGAAWRTAVLGILSGLVFALFMIGVVLLGFAS